MSPSKFFVEAKISILIDIVIIMKRIDGTKERHSGRKNKVKSKSVRFKSEVLIFFFADKDSRSLRCETHPLRDETCRKNVSENSVNRNELICRRRRSRDEVIIKATHPSRTFGKHRAIKAKLS